MRKRFYRLPSEGVFYFFRDVSSEIQIYIDRHIIAFFEFGFFFYSKSKR